MESKTNVMRILDKLKVPYAHYCYEGSGAVSGTEVAAVLGQNPLRCSKHWLRLPNPNNIMFSCCRREKSLI